MNRHKLLMSYVPIADFIAAMDSKHCEVVIHDVHDIEHSILYITQPSLTQRYRGNGMTEFTKKLIENKEYQKRSYITNYYGESENHIFRSSTFFIMDGQELAGLICVNTEIGYLLRGIEIFREAMLIDPVQMKKTEVFGIGATIEERMDAIFRRTLGNKNPKDLHVADRRYIVNELNKDGVFDFKGKITEVAKRLAISEKTIYRYLQELED